MRTNVPTIIFVYFHFTTFVMNGSDILYDIGQVILSSENYLVFYCTVLVVSWVEFEDYLLEIYRRQKDEDLD